MSSLNGELLPVEQLLLVSIRLFFRLFEGFFRVFVDRLDFFVLVFGLSTKSSSESSDGSESVDDSALAGGGSGSVCLSGMVVFFDDFLSGFRVSFCVVFEVDFEVDFDVDFEVDFDVDFDVKSAFDFTAVFFFDFELDFALLGFESMSSS